MVHATLVLELLCESCNILPVSRSQELSKQQLPGDGAYDAVVSVSASGASHSLHSLSTLLALAKPGATVVVQEPVAASPSEVCCLCFVGHVPSLWHDSFVSLSAHIAPRVYELLKGSKTVTGYEHS